MKVNFYIIWLLAGLLSSCCSESDQPLNATTKTWLPLHKKQYITYLNENQDSIIFKVKQKSFIQAGQDKICGEYNIETQETILTNQTDTAFQVKVIISQGALVKIDSYYQQPGNNNVSAMFNSISEQYITHDWRDQYLNEISLNGTLYNNVLHIYGNSVTSQISFTEIYYGQKVGLIAFRNAFGMYYLKE